MWRAAKCFTLREMTEEVNALLPKHLRISQETVRKYEQNEYPRSGPNAIVLSAMARATGNDVTDLPEQSQEDMHLVTELDYARARRDLLEELASERNRPIITRFLNGEISADDAIKLWDKENVRSR